MAIFDHFKGIYPNFDCAWAFRVIKHTLQGIGQLHANLAAHQDLKPSERADTKRWNGDEARRPWKAHKRELILPGQRASSPGH